MRVRAIVVAYNNAAFIAATLDALVASRPDKIVVVDNASSDGTGDLIASTHPDVQLVRSATNVGFGAGVNLALRDLDRASVDAVALVNSDLVVTPDWLAPLRECLTTHDDVGAACPKILFAPTFTDVRIDAPTFVPGNGDRRTLGVRCCAVDLHGRDEFGRSIFASGWSIDEGHARWTTGPAVLYAAVEPADTTVTLRFDGPDGEPDRHVEVGERFDVINNVGNELDAQLYGRDRGFQEPDRGQHDAPTDVWGWCGAAVLLRADMLRRHGLFDERYFLYYEDVELAYRQAKAGWRFRLEPSSVVRHGHAKSSGGSGAALFDHLNQRNRLVFAWEHLPWRQKLAVTGRYAGEIGRSAWGEIARPVLSGRAAHPTITRRRAKAGASALRVAWRGTWGGQKAPH
jgi:GT2 family glycosyltransferase